MRKRRKQNVQKKSGASSKSTIITDSLGFPLNVEIIVGRLDQRGRHKTYEDEQGRVIGGVPHTIEIRNGLLGEELVEVIAHEAYHLFYSLRNLITTDEETEAEVFGQLVKRLYVAHAAARYAKTKS